MSRKQELLETIYDACFAYDKATGSDKKKEIDELLIKMNNNPYLLATFVEEFIKRNKQASF